MNQHLNNLTSLEDIMIASLQAMKEIRLKVVQHDKAIKELAAKLEREHANYFTMGGYCGLHKLKVDVSDIYGLEQRAMWLSKDHGLPVRKFPDPDLGDLNTYHRDILDKVFNSLR
jgi:hypothetical protein